MATVKDFEELRIWQDARTLSKEIDDVTKNEKFSNDYRFCSQIRAAVGSIMDNIAEGFERDGKKEFIQFLYIAKASCGEVRSQLARAYDCDYISKDVYENYRQKCISESSSISSFINYLKKTDIDGLKYK